MEISTEGLSYCFFSLICLHVAENEVCSGRYALASTELLVFAYGNQPKLYLTSQVFPHAFPIEIRVAYAVLGVGVFFTVYWGSLYVPVTFSY